MQPRMQTCVTTIVVLSLISIGVRGDESPKGDLARMQGDWTVPSGFGGEVTYSFKSDELKIESPNRSYTMKIELKSDAKPEKAIDFKIVDGPEDARGKTSPGIYKFANDDTIILCFRAEGDRPARFEQIGFEQFVSELKRKPTESKAKAKVAPKAADGDAPLPQGWPGGTPPGRIEIKTYPAYRSAIARSKNATAKNTTVMFFSLFNHIQKKGVAMTAPVVMTYEPKVLEQAGARGDVSMEFLYQNTEQGQAGPGVGAVKVEDFPPVTVVSLGVQGEMNETRLREGVVALRGWLKEHAGEWVEAGPPRRLGYHGPMTPVSQQLNEVQIPVKPANARPAGRNPS